MKIRILLLTACLLLPGISSAEPKDRYAWTWEDTALQTVYSGLLIADWTQTLHIARSIKNYRENPYSTDTGYYESTIGTEQFIGKYPSKRNVNVHFATALIGHAAVSYLLPKPYRTIWQGFYIICEYDFVQDNREIGLGVNLHF